MGTASRARSAARDFCKWYSIAAESGKLTGPEKQSREQIDAVEVAYAALDAASRGDDVLAAEIVSVGVFEASQRRREALLARNVTKNWIRRATTDN